MAKKKSNKLGLSHSHDMYGYVAVAFILVVLALLVSGLK